ncbi:hypothetical protein, partial [Methanohalobium sp.]|uniref:hypothetical protein n=1 Tax=Methanohalobium sp. TaxID=2837493 RepID=UPI0025FAFC2A
EEQRSKQIDADQVQSFLDTLELAVDGSVDLEPSSVEQIEIIDSHLSSTVFINHNVDQVAEYKVGA